MSEPDVPGAEVLSLRGIPVRAARLSADGARLLRSGWLELTRPPAGQIAGLDGLRALAVLLVVADHFAANIWRQTYALDVWWLRTPVFRYGWSGVDLFFVLSGFLIGGQLWRERQRRGSIRFGRFFFRRAMRIWPLYFATLLLMLWQAGRVKPVLADWLLVSNYFPTPYARSWSLSTEEMFYLAVPVLVMVLPRLRVRYIAAGLLGLLALVDAGRWFAFSSLASQGLRTTQIVDALYSPFHLHNQGLIIGLLLSLIATHLPDWIAQVPGPRPAWRGVGVLATTTVLAAAARVAGGQVMSFTSLALLYGGLCYFVLVDRSLLSAPFRWRVFFPISRLSYGMYLNHLVFGYFAMLALVAALQARGTSPAVAFWAGLLVTVVLSALIATITFIAVEHPFLVLRNHLLTRQPPVVPVTDPMGREGQTA